MNTSATSRETVVGVFEDRRNAQQAVEDLKNAGFRDDQIGVVARDAAAAGAVPAAAGQPAVKKEAHGSHWEEGAAIGAAAGAGVGALWALGIVTLGLPALGPVIAGGILASVLASAAGGAAVAGVVGALIGLGIPEEEAKYYEGEFKAGRTIVTVRADGRYDQAYAILRRHGAYDMKSGRPAAAAAAPPAHAHQTLNVPVTREEVIVERRAVPGPGEKPAGE